MTAWTTGPLRDRARPFLQAGVLIDVDVETVELLAPLAGLTDPEVLLGLAFAVRGPRHGHVGVDLASVRERALCERALGDPAAEQRVRELPWPSDGAGWHAAVNGCALVGPAAEGRPLVAHRGLVMPRRQWRYQERLAQALGRLAEAAPPGIGGASLDTALLRDGLDRAFPQTPGAPGSTQPRLAALVAMARPLALVAGGPGTGKTFTVKKILALLHDQWLAARGRPPLVALAAPTGKAAVRMVEAIGEQLDELAASTPARTWLASLEATTLHRLLGFDPQHRTRFRHGVERPLPHEVVVVDEASMIDLALMCKLVEAVKPGSRLVLLGDPNQLGSVEAGSVLGDLCAGVGAAGARLPAAFAAELDALDPSSGAQAFVAAAAPMLAASMVQLTEPHRFTAEGGVGQLARAIVGGRADGVRCVQAWLQGQGADGVGPFAELALVPNAAQGLGAATLATIVAALLPCQQRARRGPRADETVAGWAADVLQLFDSVRVLTAHRRGPLGVDGLNRAIGEALDARLGPTVGWQVGRPVLVTENAYDVGRMNGDVGIVLAPPDRAEPCVAFPGRARGEVEWLERPRLPAHETAFAMTVHKSQGSQFEHAVLVLPSRPSALLTRELVYTAITRAKRRLTVAGELGILLDALGRPTGRASTLGADLWSQG